MDGVLLIDKPAGPTSHDVVARLRRTTGQSAIGHTGTLDPAATGLLVLVLGRATRLVSVLTPGEKTYDAAVRLGFATTTDDAEGTVLGPVATTLPADSEIDLALETFRGSYEQVPPNHSAKKIGGAKAYNLARRDRPVTLKAVTVTVHALQKLGREGDVLRLRVSAAAGFYVRALARDLGARLGCGAHLCGLRRTGSGPFRIEDALTLEAAERAGAGLAQAMLTPDQALPHLASVSVTEGGLNRALHGNFLGPEHVVRPLGPGAHMTGPVKVLAPDGRLVALAHARGGALHPVVVLG